MHTMTTTVREQRQRGRWDGGKDQEDADGLKGLTVGRRIGGKLCTKG